MLILKKTMDFKKQAAALVEKYLTEWENDPTRMESGYNYEATYAAIMKKVEHEILQLSVGHVPKGVNAKKNSIPDSDR